MNEELKRLEAELAALQPQPPSADLQRRIAHRLKDSEEPRLNADLHGCEQDRSVCVREIRGRDLTALRRRRLLLAGGAIAACVLLAFCLWPGGDERRPIAAPPEFSVPRATASAAAAFDDELPSLWQYRRACARGSDELDALLDKHAGRAPSDPPQYVQIRGFGRVDSDLHKLSGEL